jgi:hypothetical protein
MFYGAEPRQVETRAAGKDSFVDHYLPRPTSLIVYEYERGDGLFSGTVPCKTGGDHIWGLGRPKIFHEVKDTLELRIHSSRGFRDAVSHRAVAALAFIPHSEQCGMAGVDEIDDANVSLVGVFPMQAAGVLLQCAFPGYRHGQD